MVSEVRESETLDGMFLEVLDVLVPALITVFCKGWSFPHGAGRCWFQALSEADGWHGLRSALGPAAAQRAGPAARRILPLRPSVPLQALAALEFSGFGQSPAVEPRGRKWHWGLPCPPHLPARLGGGSGSAGLEGELAARQAWVQPILPAFLFLPGVSSLHWRLQTDQD